MFITQPRTTSFALVAGTAMACALGSFVLDMVDAKAGNKRSAGSEHMEKVSNALDRLAAFLCRVPDELELTHRLVLAKHNSSAPFSHRVIQLWCRHIAATAVTNPKGSEMQDAGLSYEKRVVR
jgi:hypothetical protein